MELAKLKDEIKEKDALITNLKMEKRKKEKKINEKEETIQNYMKITKHQKNIEAIKNQIARSEKRKKLKRTFTEECMLKSSSDSKSNEVTKNRNFSA